MKSEDRFDNMSPDELDNKKKWFFKESLRLEEMKNELEDERKLIDIQKNMLLRKQLENQKILFDRQWQLLENETRRLAIDKEQFERDKLCFRDNAVREARRSMSVEANVNVFFRGVDDMASLKKRYKSLQKIYHPDNMHGDSTVILAINAEYDKLSRFYLGT